MTLMPFEMFSTFLATLNVSRSTMLTVMPDFLRESCPD